MVKTRVTDNNGYFFFETTLKTGEKVASKTINVSITDSVTCRFRGKVKIFGVDCEELENNVKALRKMVKSGDELTELNREIANKWFNGIMEQVRVLNNNVLEKVKS